MRKAALLFATLLLVTLLVSSASGADVYYARCNLKVLKGNKITWINWQSSPSFIPVGTELSVEGNGYSYTLIRKDTGQSYELDTGAEGVQYLLKFVTKKRIDLSNYPPEIMSNIRAGTARNGMTKEHVYIALGPPTNLAGERTNQLTYEQILKGDNWIYARRRFGKNIGVQFDHATKKVIRTEGVWN